MLLSLSSKEPELFQEIVQDRIIKFNNTLTNSQEFNAIISCVIRKLELEDESIKKLNLTKNEKKFDQKLTTEEGFRLLIEIIFDRLACPITKRLTGDFIVLICGHSIGHQFKSKTFKCPFCKVDIESESVYYLSRNAMLKGLEEYLAQAGYIYSEEANSLNSLKLIKESHSKKKLFAFEKAEIAEKNHKHSIVIMWLTRVLHFYPK
ncbi:13863_t:CDS:1, partial [Racocetra fulgida]